MKTSPRSHKIVVNQPSIGHKLHLHSSLAGKRKLSPPKKTLATGTPQQKQGTSGAGRPSQTSDSPTEAETTQDHFHISSGSSSSLNFNSWDGIIDDYFDDMTNNNETPSHQAESNQGLSVTSDANSPQNRPNVLVNTDQRSTIEVPDSAEVEGSENNPIVLDIALEGVVPSTSQPRHSRPRRYVGPPKCFGDRRLNDVVFEKDDQTTSTVQDVTTNQPMTLFAIFSPSELLTPLAEAPQVPTLVAETTLTWSSKKSCPSQRAS